MLVDYDIEFKQLNSATLIGNSKVGEHWVLGFDADHRKSPLLQLTNALIGQNAPTLTALQGSYNPPLGDSQLRQLAIDRTATSNTFDVSATRPFGERWQFTVDVGTLELTGTPASAGVPATLSTGLEKNALLQLTGSSLLQTNDLHIFSVRGDESPLSRSTSLSWDARFVLPGAWRLGPRLSVEAIERPLARRQANDLLAATARRLDEPAIGLRGYWRLYVDQPNNAAATAIGHRRTADDLGGRAVAVFFCVVQGTLLTTYAHPRGSAPLADRAGILYDQTASGTARVIR